MAPSAPARPPGRYDEPPRRPRPAVVAAVVVLAGSFGAWVLWAALGAATPDVRGDVVGFTVLDASRVRASVTATADRRDPVTCSVQAEDRNREPVGLARVRFPAGSDATRSATTVVRTRDEAVTVVLVGCRVEGPGSPDD